MVSRKKQEVEPKNSKFTIGDGFEYEAVISLGVLSAIEEKYDMSIEDMMMELVTKRRVGKFADLIATVCSTQNENFERKFIDRLGLGKATQIALALSEDLQQLVDESSDEVKALQEVADNVKATREATKANNPTNDTTPTDSPNGTE